jgi:hypothetical protein
MRDQFRPLKNLGSKKPVLKETHIKIAKHSVSVFINQAPDLFNGVIDEINSYSFTKNEQNLILSLMERLKETDFKGDKQESAYSVLGKDSPYYDSYTRVGGKIPTLAIKQADLMKLAGLNSRAGNDINQFNKALLTLQKTYLFTYYRGTKNTKIEKVEERLPLFRVKRITEKTNERTISVYYEIAPAVAFFEEVANKFLMLPGDVRNAIGEENNKYQLPFIVFLHNRFGTYKREEIRTSYTEIAKSIKVPESLYKRNKNKVKEIINECMRVALEERQIKTFKDTGAELIINLNIEGGNFYTPKKELPESKKK